jgi:hypothetical protein
VLNSTSPASLKSLFSGSKPDGKWQEQGEIAFWSKMNISDLKPGFLKESEGKKCLWLFLLETVTKTLFWGQS